MSSVISSTAQTDEAAAGSASQDAEAGVWSSFAAASSRETFCQAWLAIQCSAVPRVSAGLLLLKGEEGDAFVPVAVWPDPRRDLAYLGKAAERALGQRRGIVLGLDAADQAQLAPGTMHVAYPIEVDTIVHGAVVLDLQARHERHLKIVLRQLFWGSGWLEALLRRRQISRDAKVLERAAIALDLVQAAQEHPALDASALSVVNELATRVGADRASLGIEIKGTLRLRAISRTAWFDHRSQLVETIENAMEEAIDQEGVVAYPASPAARGKVIVAQRDLAVRAGAAAVLSVPLINAGKPIGALTIERNEGPAFDPDVCRLCEIAGELLGPPLASRLERERWLAGKALDKLVALRDRLIGPRHPLLKLAAIGVIVAAAFLSFATGEFRISAKTVVEGAVQRAAVAPFEGYVAEAFVRAGDSVREGQVLATLDDRDLKLEKLKWVSEREQSARKYRDALARHDRSASRILAAQLDQAEAQLALTEEKLSRTRLVAPFDGIVVSGDLSQLLGAPVELGKVLFELAPLNAYRVVLKVDERDIADLAVGQRGELALTGLAAQRLPFTVKTITSVATAQEGRNFFRVEAQLQDASTRLRPGMEGVGKISVGERKLLWIWTRNFVAWLRISLWAWLP